MNRLFAICILLSMFYYDVSAEELDHNGAVPSSKKSQKTNNSQEEFKDNIKTTDQIGKATSAVGDLANSTGAKYLGSGVKSTASGLKAINSTSNCADNPNAIDCSDSVKDISNTIKAGSDNLKSLGGKSIPGVSQINNTINVGSSVVKAHDAYQRGDQEKVIEHGIGAVDAAIGAVPHIGPYKQIADVACELATDSTCLMANYKAQVAETKRSFEEFEETGCMTQTSPGIYAMPMTTCLDSKVEEIENKRYQDRLANFNNMLIENEKYQAKIRQEAQDNQKQSSPNSDDGEVFFDFIGVVLNTVIDNEVKKAESKQQAQSSGSSCQPKTFNTPDGCHPGHDENNHPGGCHCG